MRNCYYYYQRLSVVSDRHLKIQKQRNTFKKMFLNQILSF